MTAETFICNGKDLQITELVGKSCPFMAQSGRATALTNVCFEWKNGHDADVTRCLLLTQSGHRLFLRQ